MRQRATTQVAAAALLLVLAAGAACATALEPGADPQPTADAAPRTSSPPSATPAPTSAAGAPPTSSSSTATTAPPSATSAAPPAVSAPASATPAMTSAAAPTSARSAPSTPLSVDPTGAAVLVAGIPRGDPTSSTELRVMQAAALAKSYSFPGGSARVMSVVPADHATTSGNVTVSITTDFNHTFNGPPGYSLEIRTRGVGATEAHYSTCLHVAAATTEALVVPALSDTAMSRWTSISVELDTDPQCTYLDPSLPPGTAL